jgi:hypothetical protein
MVSIIMLSATILRVIMLSVIMLHVITLSVIMLSAIMLNVVAEQNGVKINSDSLIHNSSIKWSSSRSNSFFRLGGSYR